MTPNPSFPSARITYAVRDAPTPPTPTYNISGVITSNGTQPGFVTALEFTSLGTYSTASNGTYSVSVTQGYSGTVTPHYMFGNFNPQVRIYSGVVADAAQQNYAYTAAPLLTISGVVSRSGTNSSGIAVELTSIGTVTTNGSGAYSASVPTGYSGTGIPHYSSGSFTPATRSYSSLASNQTSQNYALYVSPGTENVLISRPGAFAIDFVATSSTGYFAVEDESGNITIYANDSEVVLDYVNTFCYLRPCFSATDSFNTGHLVTIEVAGVQGMAGDLDVSGLTSLTSLVVNNNDVTSITATGCPVLTNVVAYNSQLGVSELDNLLIQLNNNGALGGSASLTGLGIPTGGGATAKTALQGKGWFVDTD